RRTRGHRPRRPPGRLLFTASPRWFAPPITPVPAEGPSAESFDRSLPRHPPARADLALSHATLETFQITPRVAPFFVKRSLLNITVGNAHADFLGDDSPQNAARIAQDRARSVCTTLPEVRGPLPEAHS